MRNDCTCTTPQSVGINCAKLRGSNSPHRLSGRALAIDAYGLGRGAGAIISHLWRISVPAVGSVNNVYDYPLGLTWVLLLVLLAGSAPAWVKAKRIPPELMLAAVLWLLWWVTSQQSRWLYPFIAFGLLATVQLQLRVNRRLLVAVLAGAACISLLSQARAISTDMGALAGSIQAQQEASIVSDPFLESAKYKETLYVPHQLKVVESIDGIFVMPVGD